MLEGILAKVQEQAAKADPLGGTLKFMLDGNALYVDGSGDSNIISTDDKDADTTISTTLENLMKLQSGDLNPMMAVMSGKVKIDGDMGLAMKLQTLLG